MLSTSRKHTSEAFFFFCDCFIVGGTVAGEVLVSSQIRIDPLTIAFDQYLFNIMEGTEGFILLTLGNGRLLSP